MTEPLVTDSNSRSSVHFPYIEHIRGIAATAVLAEHTLVLTGRSEGALFGIIAGLGDWGVNLFFILSAFLLSSECFHLASRRELARFYTRRFFRIAPGYYFMLLIIYLFTVPHTLLFSQQGLKQVGANLTFTQYLFPGTASNLNANGSLWTLTIEMSLYLVLPLLSFYFTRYPRILFITYMAIGVGYRAYVAISGQGLDHFYFKAASVPIDIQKLFVMRQFIGLLPLFTLGIGARWFLSNTKYYRQVTTFFSRQSLISCLLILAPSVALCHFVARASGYQHWIWFSLFDVTMGVLMLPSILIAASAEKVSRSFLSSGLRWLGDISYGTYLWHFPIILAIFPIGNRVPTGPHYWFSVAIVVVLTLTIGTISFYFIETPTRRFGQKLAKKISAPLNAKHFIRLAGDGS